MSPPDHARFIPGFMQRFGPVVLSTLAIVLVSVPASGLELADPASLRELCALSEPVGIVESDAQPVDESDRLVAVTTTGGLLDGQEAWTEGVAARDRAHARARLLLQPHVVDVVSSGFAFDPWDDALGVLAIHVVDGVPLHGGAWLLMLEDTERILFDVDEETAEDVVALRRMGSLSMRLVFDLATASRPDVPWCHEREDGGVDLMGHLVSAELIEPMTGRVRARATTARFEASRARFGVEPSGTSPPVAPAAQVARVLVSSDTSGADEIGPIVEVFLEARLSDCYVQQLAANARLQGAMTVGFRIDEFGHGVDAEVLIDAVNTPGLAHCVLEAVSDLDVPRLGDAVANVQVTFTFDPDRDPARTAPTRRTAHED